MEEVVQLMEVEKNHNYFIDHILSKNCQNLTRFEVKTLLSRMGEGVRCFLTGDKIVPPKNKKKLKKTRF